MRNSFSFLVFLLLLFFAVPAQGAGLLALDEVVQKIQDTYEQTGQVKARFTQTVTLKAMQKTQLEEGTFYFKKPKRMRWVYTKPAAKELVINPEKAWLYVPGDKVAYVQDAAGLFRSTVSVRFLAGIGKLKDDFRISFAGDKKVDKAGNYLLDLCRDDCAPQKSGFGWAERQGIADPAPCRALESGAARVAGHSCRRDWRPWRPATPGRSRTRSRAAVSVTEPAMAFARAASVMSTPGDAAAP